MDVGVIGSGIVGQTLGSALAAKGHAVVVGTRDGGKLREWAAKTGGRARVGSFADAAAHGEIVMNATLDFSRGFPPTLFISNTESLGEQIQAAFPDTRVVKTLNTVSAVVMVTTARGTEMYLPLWARLYGKLKTPAFNIRIVT